MEHDLYEVGEGLAACHKCGGAEGTLTTHCPRVELTAAMKEAVYAGRLDFRYDGPMNHQRQGAWWQRVEVERA